jgi:hypothetical protein
LERRRKSLPELAEDAKRRKLSLSALCVNWRVAEKFATGTSSPKGTPFVTILSSSRPFRGADLFQANRFKESSLSPENGYQIRCRFKLLTGFAFVPKPDSENLAVVRPGFKMVET